MNDVKVLCVCGHGPHFHRKLGTSGNARRYCFVMKCSCARFKRLQLD